MYEMDRIVIILEREIVSKRMEKYHVGCIRNKSSIRYNKYVFAISTSRTGYEGKREKEEVKVDVKFSLRKQMLPLNSRSYLIST